MKGNKIMAAVILVLAITAVFTVGMIYIEKCDDEKWNDLERTAWWLS